MKLTYKMLKEAKESERLIKESVGDYNGVIIKAIRNYCLECGDCYNEGNGAFEKGDITLEQMKNWKLETLKEGVEGHPEFAISIAQLIPNCAINGSDVAEFISNLTENDFETFIKPSINEVCCINGKKAFATTPYSRPCKFCGNWFIFKDLEKKEALKMIGEKKGRMMISGDIAKNMKPEYIELILNSHTCGDCWNAMFGQDCSQSINESAAENNEIRDWYMNEYPKDDLGSQLRGTFDGARDCLENGGDIYDYIGVGDSIVRERLFTKMAKLYDVEYAYFYNLWLNA